MEIFRRSWTHHLWVKTLRTWGEKHQDQLRREYRSGALGATWHPRQRRWRFWLLVKHVLKYMGEAFFEACFQWSLELLWAYHHLVYQDEALVVQRNGAMTDFLGTGNSQPTRKIRGIDQYTHPLAISEHFEGIDPDKFQGWDRDFSIFLTIFTWNKKNKYRNKTKNHDPCKGYSDLESLCQCVCSNALGHWLETLESEEYFPSAQGVVNFISDFQGAMTGKGPPAAANHLLLRFKVMLQKVIFWTQDLSTMKVWMLFEYLHGLKEILKHDFSKPCLENWTFEKWLPKS